MAILSSFCTLLLSSCLILLHTPSIHAALFGLFSSPAINQDVVWLGANSSSIAHTSTDVPAVVFDQNVQPAPNLTQPNHNGLRAILYNRNQSCSAVNPHPTDFFTEDYYHALPRIALIQGGGPCTFVEKIRLAQQDGAIGAIVYDPDVPTNASDYTSDTMLVPLNTGITIPAFYVDKEAGDKLHHRVLSLSQRPPVIIYDQLRMQAVRVLMLPGNSRGPNPWELTLIIVVVLLATGFITSIFMHWHLVRKNRRLREQVEQGLIPPPPDMLPMGKQLLTTAQLEVFPLRTVPKKPSAPPPASKRNSIITSDGQVLDEDCCVICLEKVEEGDIVRELPCKHEYHQGCIDPWLTTKCAECPLCKADFSTPSPHDNDKPGEARHEGVAPPLSLERDSTAGSNSRTYRDRLLDILLQRQKRRQRQTVHGSTVGDQDVELANVATSDAQPPTPTPQGQLHHHNTS